MGGPLAGNRLEIDDHCLITTDPRKGLRKMKLWKTNTMNTIHTSIYSRKGLGRSLEDQLTCTMVPFLAAEIEKQFR